MGNQEWLRNRKAFDRTGRVRRHYVVEETTTPSVVGYGGVEELATPDTYRIFLVMSPDLLASDVGDLLYDRLTRDLREMNASAAVAQEKACDLALARFL